jgi:hypothetical protein
MAAGRRNFLAVHSAVNRVCQAAEPTAITLHPLPDSNIIAILSIESAPCGPGLSLCRLRILPYPSLLAASSTTRPNLTLANDKEVLEQTCVHGLTRDTHARELINLNMTEQPQNHRPLNKNYTAEIRLQSHDLNHITILQVTIRNRRIRMLFFTVHAESNLI